MAHVSKITVSPKVSLRIKQNLIHAATQERGIIIESLLTPTETLMLAKRLAMIVMLERGDTTYRVGKTLKVSVSSVRRYKAMLDRGIFRPIVRALRKKNRSILEILELLMAAGMPSIAGPRAQRRLEALRSGGKPED